MDDPFARVAKSTYGSKVAAELERLSPLYGFSVMNDVVCAHGLLTVAIDHVVVDRYGILIVDAEIHTGAAIRGTDTDDNWSATSPDGQVVEFRNPIQLNAGNEILVRQVLAENHVLLEPSQIRSAVVFVGADTSSLNLVDVSALKVKDAEHIAEILEGRYNFPPNNGQLTGPDIDRILAVLSELTQAERGDSEQPGSWTADPAVVASNAEARLVVAPPTGNQGALYRPAELAGHHSGISEGPSLRSALLTIGTIVLIILTVIAAALFLPELQAGSTLAWTAALVLLVGLAELVAANIAASKPSRRRTGFVGGALRFGMRLVLVFIFVAAAWAFVAGGVAQRVGALLAERFEPTIQQEQSLSPGVIAAKRRLKENAPEVFNSAVNLNSPDVEPQPDGTTSYTWKYVPAGGTASQTAPFTLTLGVDGRVVRPSESK